MPLGCPRGTVWLAHGSSMERIEMPFMGRHLYVAGPEPRPGLGQTVCLGRPVPGSEPGPGPGPACRPQWSWARSWARSSVSPQ